MNLAIFDESMRGETLLTLLAAAGAAMVSMVVPSSRRNPSAMLLVSANFKKCCITRLSSSLFTMVHLITLTPSGSCNNEKV